MDRYFKADNGQIVRSPDGSLVYWHDYQQKMALIREAWLRMAAKADGTRTGFTAWLEAKRLLDTLILEED